VPLNRSRISWLVRPAESGIGLRYLSIRRKYPRWSGTPTSIFSVNRRPRKAHWQDGRSYESHSSREVYCC
jgi:hypothetical protein